MIMIVIVGAAAVERRAFTPVVSHRNACKELAGIKESKELVEPRLKYNRNSKSCKAP